MNIYANRLSAPVAQVDVYMEMRDTVQGIMCNHIDEDLTYFEAAHVLDDLLENGLELTLENVLDCYDY